MAQDLLRFTTAGSVDDGKSTLMGRLLYDARVIYDDHAAAVRGRDGVMDFARLTDGLRAEREQGITIDVAYRYFATPRRRFIIADTPGHEQYTRNMATGASTANAAVILVDAARGLQAQTRRHAAIARLLGIPQIVAAINKMDLVGYSEARFRELAAGFANLAAGLGARPEATTAIPVSAITGENVVAGSQRMSWHAGPALLELLESLPAAQREGRDAPWRLPVQMVLRGGGGRSYAGQLAGGVLAAGREAALLPSGERVTVVEIRRGGTPVPSAEAGDSITVTLDRDVDLGRGDWLAPVNEPPTVASHLRASVVWLHAQPARPGATYLLKHTTRTLRARLDAIDGAESLEMNAIGSTAWESSQPLYFDPYTRNRATGGFIVIDPLHFGTVGAGMIQEATHDAD